MSSKNNLNSKKKPKPVGNFVYDFIKVTGALPTMVWMRPRVIHPNGRKRIKGGFMASANHCSFLDPILLHCVFWKRRIYSLATKDLYRSDRLTWFFNHMHCIPVDKENFSLDSFHEVTRRLKQGKVVSIFPEGQLNHHTEEILAFKSGAILMAYCAKVPIVPVYLVPHGSWYQRRVAIVGDPIDVCALCGKLPTEEDIANAGRYVRQKEQELKAYYENTVCRRKAPKDGDEPPTDSKQEENLV